MNETTAEQLGHDGYPLWQPFKEFATAKNWQLENFSPLELDEAYEIFKAGHSHSTTQIAALRSALESIRGLPNGKSHTRAIGIAIKALAGQGIDRI